MIRAEIRGRGMIRADSRGILEDTHSYSQVFSRFSQGVFTGTHTLVTGSVGSPGLSANIQLSGCRARIKQNVCPLTSAPIIGPVGLNSMIDNDRDSMVI